MLAAPRYSASDHWIQASIKQIFNSGLFWAIGAAERKKNPNCHKYATFDDSFLCLIFKNNVASALKRLHSIYIQNFLKVLESILILVKTGVPLLKR